MYKRIYSEQVLQKLILPVVLFLAGCLTAAGQRQPVSAGEVSNDGYPKEVPEISHYNYDKIQEAANLIGLSVLAEKAKNAEIRIWHLKTVDKIRTGKENKGKVLSMFRIMKDNSIDEASYYLFKKNKTLAFKPFNFRIPDSRKNAINDTVFKKSVFDFSSINEISGVRRLDQSNIKYWDSNELYIIETSLNGDYNFTIMHSFHKYDALPEVIAFKELKEFLEYEYGVFDEFERDRMPGMVFRVDGLLKYNDFWITDLDSNKVSEMNFDIVYADENIKKDGNSVVIKNYHAAMRPENSYIDAAYYPNPQILDYNRVIMDILEYYAREAKMYSLKKSSFPGDIIDEAYDKVYEFKKASKSGLKGEIIKKYHKIYSDKLKNTPRQTEVEISKSVNDIGIYAGAGYKNFAGDITDYFDASSLSGRLGFYLNFKRVDISLSWTLNSGTIADTLSGYWLLGDRAEMSNLSLQYGLEAYSSHKHLLIPFAGIHMNIFSFVGSLPQNEPETETSFRYSYGLNYRWKFGKSPGLELSAGQNLVSTFTFLETKFTVSSIGLTNQLSGYSFNLSFSLGLGIENYKYKVAE